eukprot:697885-Hanusia_phi.AAC.1
MDAEPMITLVYKVNAVEGVIGRADDCLCSPGSGTLVSASSLPLPSSSSPSSFPDQTLMQVFGRSLKSSKIPSEFCLTGSQRLQCERKGGREREEEREWDWERERRGSGSG